MSFIHSFTRFALQIQSAEVSLSTRALATITHTEALAFLVAHSAHHILRIAHLARHPHVHRDLLVLLSHLTAERAGRDCQRDSALQRTGFVQEHEHAVALHAKETAGSHGKGDHALLVVLERDDLGGIGHHHLVVEDELRTAIGGEGGVVGELVEESQGRGGVEHDGSLKAELVSSTIDKRDRSIALDVRVVRNVMMDMT